MEIKLQATETRGVYTGIIAGKKSVVTLTERDRTKAEYKENAATVAPSRLRAGLKLAGELNAPFVVAVSVSVAGRFNHSVAVSYETFKKIKSATSDFGLGPKARAIFEAEKSTVQNARYEIQAAPKATTAAKQEPAKLQAKAQAA
jgi:hypothetical protein